MVFFFQIVHEHLTPSKYIIYMGRDKFENEDLIKYGLPTDLWFHVDNLSSAHVYLRIPKGMKIDDIPDEVVEDCCQMVKANSIAGCKKASCKIVYTMWENLKKQGHMAVGQIGFHKENAMKYRTIEKNKEIISRVNKTKVEKETGIIKEMRSRYEMNERKAEKKRKQEEAVEELRSREERKKQAELQNYSGVFVEENMTSNADIDQTAEDFEEDFM